MFGIFWKCARVGERLSPYIAICCLLMTVSTLLGSLLKTYYRFGYYHSKARDHLACFRSVDLPSSHLKIDSWHVWTRRGVIQHAFAIHWQLWSTYEIAGCRNRTENSSKVCLDGVHLSSRPSISPHPSVPFSVLEVLRLSNFARFQSTNCALCPWGTDVDWNDDCSTWCSSYWRWELDSQKKAET